MQAAKLRKMAFYTLLHSQSSIQEGVKKENKGIWTGSVPGGAAMNRPAMSLGYHLFQRAHDVEMTSSACCVMSIEHQGYILD